MFYQAKIVYFIVKIKGMKAFLLLIFACLMTIGCGVSKENVTATVEDRNVERLLTQKRWEIESDWASPLLTNSMNAIYNAGLFPPGSVGSQINLMGSTNYFIVNGENIRVYLPFYGDRQMSAGYNFNDAIEFEGVPLKYEERYNKRKKATVLRIDFRDGPEFFRSSITIFDNGKSQIVVYGSHRTAIWYRGEITEISDTKNSSITVQ